jgi:nitrogen-specific signal transduction histidine kinase
MHRRSSRRVSVGHTAIQQPTHIRQSPGEIAHDLRNGLAGVRAAVQIVRDRLVNSPERDILGAAMARLDRIDDNVRALLVDEAEEASHRSGVRRIVLPRDSEEVS